MSTSRHFNKICIAVVAIMLVLTILFMCGKSLGIPTAEKTVKYENTIFDTSYVHKIDIVMDDWDSFIENCENEEYTSCTVVVDGDKHSNIAIRAKGNTSLSSVKAAWAASCPETDPLQCPLPTRIRRTRLKRRRTRGRPGVARIRRCCWESRWPSLRLGW